MRSGSVDFLTASIITNAAFDVVRRGEDEIFAAAPSLFDRKRSYETIAVIIFYADALSQGQNPEAKINSNEFLRPTPFDGFICLSVARCLLKFDWMCTRPNQEPMTG